VEHERSEFDVVLEYRVQWEGPPGTPGTTVLHGRPADLAIDSVAAEELATRAHDFFDAIKLLIPTSYVLTFPGEAVKLNTTTGDLEDVYVFDAPSDVDCGGTGGYLAASGARIEWRTDAIVSGRRLRGRTFIVPITGASSTEAGQLDLGTILLLQGAADEYFATNVISDCNPCVWSKTHGILADVTSASVPTRGSVMRSRRD